MANYCGAYHGRDKGRKAVLGDFDVFFEKLRPDILPFFRWALCFASVCEGHGSRIFAFMDWVGGFWLVHEAMDDDDPEEMPKPLRIPDSEPLTQGQIDDLAALRGYTIEETKECLDAGLYAVLVELGAPPQPPAKAENP